MKINWEKPDYQFDNKSVSLWLVNIEEHSSSIANFMVLLDDEEKRRAERFKFAKDRNCYIISHGALRILLGGCLGRAPGKIKFEINQYGKPTLAEKKQPLYFNLSHSGARALIAINKNHPVGVDIECMQKKNSMEDIVKRFFSKHEYEEYKQLPEEQKLLGFYNGWTRKEAFVKTIGQGISYSLKKFTVNLTPGDLAKVLSVGDDVVDVTRWKLYGFVPEKNYCAAVAWAL